MFISLLNEAEYSRAPTRAYYELVLETIIHYRIETPHPKIHFIIKEQ